jgi:hypothetical protein
MVPESFIAGGNRSYLDLWAVINDLWYLGYKTMIDWLEVYSPMKIDWLHKWMIINCSRFLFSCWGFSQHCQSVP